MNLKNSSSETPETFLNQARYLGIAIESSGIHPVENFVDLEKFFLAATYCLNSSRIAEGFLCCVLKYGHLLSPSKVRRLIRMKTHYDPAVLGGFISYFEKYGVNDKQWKILKPFIKKSKEEKPLVAGPSPSKRNPYFMKYNIVAHSFKLDNDKFLMPTSYVYKNCHELKNRALFGSSVNADVASYLAWHPEATPYEVSKATCNHKARVFEVFQDVKTAL